MSGVWHATRAAAIASHRAGRAMSRATDRGIAGVINGRGSRAVARGLVGPWDPQPPAGSSDYRDYTGVARPGDLNCDGWLLPLGRYVRPKHPWNAREEIGLTPAEVNRHTMVLGPTRAGKTAGLIAPWLFEAARVGYHVVSVDVKGNCDLENEVLSYRNAVAPGTRFPLWRWNYQDPQRSMSWNFIADLKTDAAVNAAAEAICGRPRDNDPNRNFHLRDLKWAKGLLELAHDTGKPHNVQTLLGLLADQDALVHLVRRNPRSRGAQRLEDLTQLDSYEYAKATQFLATYFETVNTPGFVDVTSAAQVSMDRLAFENAGLTIVTAPIADKELSATSSGLFLAELLARRLSSYAANRSPMLLALDEAPRLFDRIDLGSLLSLAAGANVSVLLGIQDITQIPGDRRDEMMANCGTVVLLSGANHTTTEYAAKQLGTRVRQTVSRSHSYDHRGRTHSYTTGSETVPVLGHNELANPPSGIRGAVVINNRMSMRPILIDLTRPDL